MTRAAYGAWLALGLGVVMDALGVFLIKQAVSGTGTGLGVEALASLAWLLASTPRGVFGLALFLLAPVAMAHGLSRLDLSVAYPMKVGGTFVCVVALSALALAEPLTVWRVFGVSLIGAGSWLIIGSDAAEAA